MGPVAHEASLIKVVSGGDERHSMALRFQLTPDVFIDIGDKSVGFHIGHGPTSGAIVLCFRVPSVEFLRKRDKIDHHAFRAMQHFTRGGVCGSDDLFEPTKKGVFSGSKSDEGFLPGRFEFSVPRIRRGKIGDHLLNACIIHGKPSIEILEI